MFSGNEKSAASVSFASLKGYDFSTSSIENITQKCFKFGPKDSQSVSVDQTLAHLFDTLSVECCGILVHPQWKHFRHIRMLKNDQIRLSNGIWRSWHLQFQKKRTPLYCRFDMEPELDHHKGQQAVVLEGKYWKRRPDAVATEYRKWRFYREKSMKKPDPSLDKVREKASEIFYELTSDVKMKSQEMQVDPLRASTSLLQNAEDFALKFLQKNSRVSLDGYNAYDMMVQQPNLDMLNPMLDDFLNKLSEPIDSMMAKPVSQQRSFFAGSGTASHITPSEQRPQTQHPSLYPSQQQQEAPILMQLSLENLQTSTQKDLQQSSLIQQASFPSYLSGYQDTRLTEQMRYSPSSFLNLTTQEQNKGEEDVLNIQQQVENFPMKCEPSSIEEQLVVESGSSQAMQDSSVYQSTEMDQGFQQNQMDEEDYDSRGVADSEMLFRTQQEQNLDDDSVFNQFYQSERSNNILARQQESLAQEMTLPPPHCSPGNRTPQDQAIVVGGGGAVMGGFQYSTTPDLTTTPPPRQQRKPSTNEEMMSPFLRVASAGELSACSDGAPRPPLERGKSEPIRHLRDKVRSLNVQQIKQMKEVDKQKNIAEVQYSELLMELMPGAQQAKAERSEQQVIQNALSDPSLASSEQQQQALHNVLSDPNLVKILRSVLLTTQTTGSQPPVFTSPPLTPASAHSTQEGIGIPQMGNQQSFASPSVLSPTELSKATGVSDFQSRLLVAAVSQVKPTAGLPSAFVMNASSPSPSATVSLDSPPLPYESDTSPTQTMINKFKNSRHLTSSEKEVYKEIRRQSHISAEQKRRGSIKQGFDHLQMLVINTPAYPSGKVSKATILEKTLEHIQKYHNERNSREQQVKRLKARIEELNAAIALCQEQLPASGAPVTRQRFEENRQRFALYIQKRTLQNYKFWIFSIILQQLFESYNSMVSIGTVDELCRTVLAWFEQNCTLPALRPIVMNSLKELSLKTSILSDPSQVPRQLTQYAQQNAQEQDLRTRRQQQLDMSLYS